MRAAHAPTFALLREKRTLAVRSPGRGGVRFTVSLRDWEGVLWAVRVGKKAGSEGGKGEVGNRKSEVGAGKGGGRGGGRENPYVTAHRIMDRARIEDWLSELRLDACGEGKEIGDRR